MAFDPDQYISEKGAGAGGFDPDQYLAQKTPTLQSRTADSLEPTVLDWANPAQALAQKAVAGVVRDPKAGMAGLEHFGNAVSLGYLPQMQAATEPLTAKIGDMITGQNVSKDLPSYVERRDANIARLKQEQQEHPTASNVGTGAGIVAGAGALSGAAALNAPTMIGRALQAGKVGAAMGAIANPGDTEGVVDPVQLGDRAKNAALNGATSMVMAPASELATKGAVWLADKVGGVASKAAARALGPYQRDVRVNGIEGMGDIGQEALEQKVIGWMPKGWEKLSGAAAEARDRVGQELENLVTNLSQSQAAQNLPGLPRAAVAQALRGKLIQPVNGNPTIRAQNDTFEKLIQEFESSGVPQLSLPSLREVKEGAKGMVNWKRIPGTDVPPAEEFNRALYGQMKGAEENAAGQIGQAVGGGQDAELQRLKGSYGNLAQGADMAQTRAEKESANRFLGLSDYIAGGAGAGVGAYVGDKIAGEEGRIRGAEIGGLVGGLGNKVGRTYGNQAIAKGAFELSKLLAASPALQALYNKSPALVSGLLQQRLGGQNKEALPSPPVFDQFKNNPSQIDKLPDGPLKEALMKRYNRAPSDAGDTGTNEHTNPKNLITPDDARKQFREGN